MWWSIWSHFDNWKMPILITTNVPIWTFVLSFIHNICWFCSIGSGFSVEIDVSDPIQLRPLFKPVDHSNSNDNDEYHSDLDIPSGYCSWPVQEFYRLRFVSHQARWFILFYKADCSDQHLYLVASMRFIYWVFLQYIWNILRTLWVWFDVWQSDFRMLPQRQNSMSAMLIKDLKFLAMAKQGFIWTQRDHVKPTSVDQENFQKLMIIGVCCVADPANWQIFCRQYALGIGQNCISG